MIDHLQTVQTLAIKGEKTTEILLTISLCMKGDDDLILISTREGDHLVKTPVTGEEKHDLNNRLKKIIYGILLERITTLGSLGGEMLYEAPPKEYLFETSLKDINDDDTIATIIATWKGEMK